MRFILLLIIANLAYGQADGHANDMMGPSADDMADAKLLYVKMLMDWNTNPQITSIEDMRAFLGDGNGTDPWAHVAGLRHKYFTWNEATQTVYGVYVFFTQEDMDNYMASELFTGAQFWPHVAELSYQAMDVMPGSEMSVERTDWANDPPTRQDLVNAKMLIVDLEMDYNTGVEGMPASVDEFYAFIAGGYPGSFGDLPGLRSKYFAYDATIDHCYGVYTFTNQADLDSYLASELFLTQGDPPHVTVVGYEVQDVLEGSERTMDMGSWGYVDDSMTCCALQDHYVMHECTGDPDKMISRPSFCHSVDDEMVTCRELKATFRMEECCGMIEKEIMRPSWCGPEEAPSGEGPPPTGGGEGPPPNA